MSAHEGERCAQQEHADLVRSNPPSPTSAFIVINLRARGVKLSSELSRPAAGLIEASHKIPHASASARARANEGERCAQQEHANVAMSNPPSPKSAPIDLRGVEISSELSPELSQPAAGLIEASRKIPHASASAPARADECKFSAEQTDADVNTHPPTPASVCFDLDVAADVTSELAPLRPPVGASNTSALEADVEGSPTSECACVAAGDADAAKDDYSSSPPGFQADCADLRDIAAALVDAVFAAVERAGAEKSDAATKSDGASDGICVDERAPTPQFFFDRRSWDSTSRSSSPSCAKRELVGKMPATPPLRETEPPRPSLSAPAAGTSAKIVDEQSAPSSVATPVPFGAARGGCWKGSFDDPSPSRASFPSTPTSAREGSSAAPFDIEYLSNSLHEVHLARLASLGDELDSLATGLADSLERLGDDGEEEVFCVPGARPTSRRQTCARSPAPSASRYPRQAIASCLLKRPLPYDTNRAAR
jgi:hypothetical protein